ncbi:J domain-containing protein [Oscillatoria amoena NRMC-F 0135]|nr:J domain-containing protein [Oscillatoria amoena NRMC-F 0135]
MNNYYQVLGVQRNAHAAEIKRAYRKLVQQLHPDINPDPQAQELIRLVNEAYDVLGDEAKRREYDYRLENPYAVTYEPPPHRDPRYQGSRTYRPPRKKDTTQLDLMTAALPFMKPVAIAGCLIFLFLLVDFFLPPTQQAETIIRFRNEGYRRGWQDYLVTNTGREIKISAEDVQVLSVNSPLVFTESALIGVLLNVRTPDGSVTIGNLGTLYGNFIFVPLLLMVGSGLGIFSVGSVEFRFNLGLVNLFILIFNLVLIILS